MKAEGELRQAADVVVDHEASGTLLLSGRALQRPERVTSVSELVVALSRVRRPATVVVRVKHPRALLEPVPLDVVSKQAELEQLMRAHGFVIARGSYSTPGWPPSRPTPR